MHIYGLHDARRSLITIAHLFKGIIAYIFVTLLLNIFFMLNSKSVSPDQAIAAHMSISTVLNFVVLTFFMGRIIEIIFGLSPLPVGALLRKHLPKFILTTILLSLIAAPLFVIASQFPFPQNPSATFLLPSIGIKVFTIYIFPLVFITSQVRFAIVTGAKCLIGNFKDSQFLIALSISAFLFEGYALPSLVPAFQNNPIFIVAATACNIFFSLYLFTAAAWIMREKLYSEGEDGPGVTLH